MNEIEGIAYELIDEYLRAGREARLEIHTESMMPVLRPGDRVIVCGAKAGDLQVGDIVLVRVGSRLLAHRMISSHIAGGESRLVTKGDNALETDQEWAAPQVCGVAIAVERNGQRISLVSARARRYAAVIARLARMELAIRRAHQGLFQRIALKGSRVLRRVSASLAP